MTDGWPIPLPSRPVKGDEDLRRKREAKIAGLERRGTSLSPGGPFHRSPEQVVAAPAGAPPDFAGRVSIRGAYEL
jgi:hypothetical protein